MFLNDKNFLRVLCEKTLCPPWSIFTTEDTMFFHKEHRELIIQTVGFSRDS